MEAECGQADWSVARVDLFADWQGWSFSHAMTPSFVGRAKDRVTYQSGDVCTGFGFGSRASNTFFGRLYDKTAEIEGNGHDWWRDVWGPRFNPAELVHRTEFEIGRDGLRSFGLRSPGEVLAGVGDLWKYCTEDWLTYRTPTADQTRHRWPIAPEWLSVQSCTLLHQLVGLERLKERGRSGALRLLMPTLNGTLTSFGSFMATETIEDTLAELPAYLREYEALTNVSFEARVAQKRRDRLGDFA